MKERNGQRIGNRKWNNLCPLLHFLPGKNRLEAALVLFHVAAVAESPHVVQRVASTCPPGFDVCHIVGLWITVESRGLHKRDTAVLADSPVACPAIVA